MKGLEALLIDGHMNEDARVIYAEQFQTDLALLKHRQRNRIDPNAVSASECEICGNPIPEARRVAVPGVTLCVDCKNVEDHYERKYG